MLTIVLGSANAKLNFSIDKSR